MQSTKPPSLRTGDTIAAITPSWAGPSVHPHRYETGKRQLEEAFGVRVVEMRHTMADPDFVSDHPEARAEDLHEALTDPSIAGIVASVGGDDSIRILPYLDLDLIRANPKPLVGYSDVTILHMALHRAGVVSFYGPSIMAGFGENGGLHPYLVEGVRQMLFSCEPTVWPENADGWTVEYLDWGDPSNQATPRRLHPSVGWRWDGDTVVEGPLIAGCMEVLDWLRGSPWWPDLRGAILAFETSEEAPPPEAVERFLRSLAASGELQQLEAILFGRPGGSDLSEEQHDSYYEAILRVVRHENRLNDIPIVMGLDFGHTDPMWTLPIGVVTRVDPQNRKIETIEPGCSV